MDPKTGTVPEFETYDSTFLDDHLEEARTTAQQNETQKLQTCYSLAPGRMNPGASG